MSDSFRTTFPISVEFYDGELPSSVKMNGLARQAKQGLSLIESAIGDLWNQSGDSFLSTLTDARLLIPNISRYIGSTQKLNPRIPNLLNLQEYTHTFSVVGNEFQLPYSVHSGSTFSWTNSSNQSSPESSKGNVNATGEWYLDYETGYIFSYDQLSATTTITYQPGYFDENGAEQYGIHGDIAENADYNIIPDLETDVSYNFRGLKLEYVNGADDSEGYYVYLPPRMPLQASRQLDVSPVYTNNNESSPDSVHDRKFFQNHTADASTSDATNAEHYRYNLPRLLTDSVNWSSGALLPDGLMYLYDESGSSTIVEGLKFYAETAVSPRKWVLVVKGENLTTWLSTSQGLSQYPTARLESSSHEYANYPVNGLKLITVGTDLSKAFSSLLKQFLNHDHSSQGSFPTKRISHSSLFNLIDPSEDFGTSGLTGDDHTQYFHRSGYNILRDQYNNAILGELVVSSTGSSNNFLNTTSDSNKISFGKSRNDDGASLFWNSSDNQLEAIIPSNITTPGIQIRKDGTNGNGDSNNPGESTSLTVGTIYPGSEYDSTYGYSGSAGDGWGPVREYIVAPGRFIYGEMPDGNPPDRNLWTPLSGPLFGQQSGTYTVGGYTTSRHNYYSASIATPSASGRTTYARFDLDLPYVEYAIVDLEFYYGVSKTGIAAGLSIAGLLWDFFSLRLAEASALPFFGTVRQSIQFGDSSFAATPNGSHPTVTESFSLVKSAFGYSYHQSFTQDVAPFIQFENHIGVGSLYNLLFGPVIIKYRIKEW